MPAGNNPKAFPKHVPAVLFAFVSVVRTAEVANGFWHACTRCLTDNTSAPGISGCRTSLSTVDVAN